MDRRKLVEGTVTSEKGFYVGDICYVLDEEKVYFGVWQQVYGFKNGVFEVPGIGHSFAVASTSYGDGEYVGSDRFHYWVDAGVIGLVPMELVETLTPGGRFIEGAGTASFRAENGKFQIVLPDGEEILIETEASW
jgi:hypothetical protein